MPRAAFLDPFIMPYSIRPFLKDLCILSSETISEAFPPQVGPLEHGPWIKDAHPYGVAPTGNSLFHPVVRLNVLALPRAEHEVLVVLDGDEVRVRPLTVQKVKHLPLVVIKGCLWSLVALTPRGNDYPATWFEHANHLFYVLFYPACAHLTRMPKRHRKCYLGMSSQVHP